MYTLTLHAWHILIDRRNKTISSPWHHLGFFYSYFLPSCLQLNLALFFFSQHLPELLCLASDFFATSPFKPLPLSRIRGNAAVKLRRGFFFPLLFSFFFECTAITTGYELSSTVIDVFNFLSVSRSLFPSLWPDKHDVHTLIVYVCFTQHS